MSNILGNQFAYSDLLSYSLVSRFGFNFLPRFSLFIPRWPRFKRNSSIHNGINPLRPNNDLSQTSHCNIKGVSVREVMRIEYEITPVKLY